MTQQRQLLIEDFFEAIAMIHRSMITNRDKLLRRFHLNRAQIEALFILKHGQATTVKSLADTMHVTSSAATQLIEGLVKLGFVERIANNTDRRKVAIQLTASGKSKLRDCKNVLRAHIEPRLEDLNNQDLAAVVRVARKIAEAAANDKEKIIS